MAINRVNSIIDGGGEAPAYTPIVPAEQFNVKTPAAPGKLPTTSVGGFRQIDYNAAQAAPNAQASLDSRVAVSRFIDNLSGNEQAFYQSVINTVGGLQNLTQNQLNTLFSGMQKDMRDPNTNVGNRTRVTANGVNNWIKNNLSGTGVVTGPTTITKPGDIGTGTVVSPTSPTSTTFNPNDVNNNGIPDNLEAAQLQIDAQTRAAAEARRIQLEDAAARGKAAIDLLKETIKQYFTMSGDDRFVDDLSSIIDNYVKEGYDAATISVMLPQTQPYKVRFSGNEARIKAGLSALSPSNYIQAEETYNDILKRYNLSDVATRETFASLIGGQVSADELADRVVNVYDRIRNADPALRAEINRVEDLSRGQLTDADFAKALLTGDKGAAQLKRKIATAEIAAEARIRSEQLQRQGFAPGLTVDTAEDLQKLGVTREQARAGFEQIALTQPRLTQLSEMYTGETPEATGLQRELEAEQFQGLQSQRRRRLAEQETTAFMGQSGTASGISLGRRRAGQI